MLERENDYPGRFIGVGISSDEKNLILIYGVTVRSDPNRNRKLIYQDGIVRTVLADPNKKSGVADLILYPAIVKTRDGRFVVSNGVQTEPIAQGIEAGSSLEFESEKWEYEKDSNSTERISAVVSVSDITFARISRKSDDSEESQRDFYTVDRLTPGAAKVIHTYAKNGTPTPPSHAAPYDLPIEGGPTAIAQAYRENLGSFFLSVAVMSIDRNTMQVDHVEILNAAEPAA